MLMFDAKLCAQVASGHSDGRRLGYINVTVKERKRRLEG